jgi:hypothetical protein
LPENSRFHPTTTNSPQKTTKTENREKQTRNQLETFMPKKRRLNRSPNEQNHQKPGRKTKKGNLGKHAKNKKQTRKARPKPKPPFPNF